MKYVYEAIVEPSAGFLEARFPDLDIITSGEDPQDVAFMAQDLLENYIVVALDFGRELPAPTFNHDCKDNEYRMVVAVECDADTPQVETMSVAEAADILDVSDARIRAMIRDGVLKSTKVGNVHMVDAESVMKRFNEPIHIGRPKKVVSLNQAPSAAQA